MIQSEVKPIVPQSHNARYTKLRIKRRERYRHCFYSRIRKVIPLPTSTCISRKVIRNVSSAQQPIEILSIKYPSVRRNQSTVISQDYIFKVISNICGVTNVVSCLAVLCQRDLSSAEAELCDFTVSCTSHHKALRQFLLDCPVVIDISIVAEPNSLFTRYCFLVNAAYAYVGNISQSNNLQGKILS